MKRVITFGELMLRLSPPGFERFLQTPQFVATFGGGVQPFVAEVNGKVEEQVTRRPGTRPAAAVTWKDEMVS